MNEIAATIGFLWGLSGVANVVLIIIGDLWPRIICGGRTKPWMKKWSWWLALFPISFFVLMFALFGCAIFFEG